MRISDWSSDVCSSDLPHRLLADLGTRDHARYRFLPHLHRRQLRRPDEGGAKGRGGEDEQGKTESEGGGSETGENHDSGKGKRSEEHTSELQSLMRISYAVFCLKKKKKQY